MKPLPKYLQWLPDVLLMFFPNVSNFRFQHHFFFLAILVSLLHYRIFHIFL